MLDVTYGAECNLFTDDGHQSFNLHQDEVAEWLRRWTANPMGSACVGSNPIVVGCEVSFSLYAAIRQVESYASHNLHLISVIFS